MQIPSVPRHKAGLSRREALKAAYQLVKDASLPQKEKEEILFGLDLCLSELPFAQWSQAAIFDACDQFILDKGRLPRLRDFNRAGLPSHPTVKNRFGLSLRQFLDRYYPPATGIPTRSPYGGRPASHWLDIFQREYRSLLPKSAAAYNAQRPKGTPSWATLAKMLGLKTWRELLTYCGFSPRSLADQIPGYRVYADSPSFRKLRKLQRRMAKEDTAI